LKIENLSGNDIHDFYKKTHLFSYFRETLNSCNFKGCFQQMSPARCREKINTENEIAASLRSSSLHCCLSLPCRYKFVVNVHLGDCSGQQLVIASRSLWNEETDGYVTATRKTARFFVVAIVHAVYFE